MEGCCPFYFWFCVFCFGVSKAVVVCHFRGDLRRDFVLGGTTKRLGQIGPVYRFRNREEPFFIQTLGTPHEISCWSIEVAGNGPTPTSMDKMGWPQGYGIQTIVHKVKTKKPDCGAGPFLWTKFDADGFWWGKNDCISRNLDLWIFSLSTQKGSFWKVNGFKYALDKYV